MQNGTPQVEKHGRFGWCRAGGAFVEPFYFAPNGEEKRELVKASWYSPEGEREIQQAFTLALHTNEVPKRWHWHTLSWWGRMRARYYAVRVVLREPWRALAS
jgi:hypothetical protein